MATEPASYGAGPFEVALDALMEPSDLRGRVIALSTDAGDGPIPFNLFVGRSDDEDDPEGLLLPNVTSLRSVMAASAVFDTAPYSISFRRSRVSPI